MQLFRSIAQGAFKYVSRGNAERLWMHYSLALLIIFGLLFSTHLVNRTIIDRGIAVADVINTSRDQVLLGHEVLIFAEAALLESTHHFDDLDLTVVAFEDAHRRVTTAQIWSDDLHQHYYDLPNLLDEGVQDFVGLARQLRAADPSGQRLILTQLKAAFTNERLKGALLEATQLLDQAGRAEVERLSGWQATLIRLSIALLIIEVLVIFVPAQLIVRSNIRQLRAQGDSLRNSQAQLQHANGQLEHLINHDALTGLPNRSSLMTHLKNVLADDGAPELGVLLIGLDGFKSINDTAGHDFGDEVLIQVAGILKSCIDDDHVVARIGGDEFVLITDEAAKVLVDRIRASFADPLELRGRRLPVSMSIGYLEMSVGRQDPQAVMADVGLALQVAKNRGGNRTQHFHGQLRDEIGTMRELQLELIDAIKNGEIEPWFQPQIRLADGMLHGVEVLARWRHPKRGLLTPDKFLPAAELSGLMVDMDHSIWRAAMDHAQNWQRENLWRPCISLNAAPDTISDPYLIERFLFQLQQTDLGADQVVVEVLETTLIEGNDDMAAINIDSLAECGIALELDDFGTGYASLSKLTQLPLSGIKLDRSLVAPLPDQNADSVVRAILALASELGLHVVAEGVEEEAQAQHLSSRGCAIGQGYGYAKPMPPQAFTEWLTANANRALLAGGDALANAKRA
ncbi:MAG: EAL domain-containing protein [Pseudomonadota bacterium]